MKYLLALLLCVVGCNTAVQDTDCGKRDVEGTTCIVCGRPNSNGGIAVSCKF